MRMVGWLIMVGWSAVAGHPLVDEGGWVADGHSMAE